MNKLNLIHIFLEQETKKREEILATEALRLNAEKNLTKVIEGKAQNYQGKQLALMLFLLLLMKINYKKLKIY